MGTLLETVAEQAMVGQDLSITAILGTIASIILIILTKIDTKKARRDAAIAANQTANNHDINLRDELTDIGREVHTVASQLTDLMDWMHRVDRHFGQLDAQMTDLTSRVTALERHATVDD